MKKVALILAIALSGLFVAGQVWAGPGSGLGIGGGFASHTTDVDGDASGPGFEFDSDGFALVADWQIVMSDSFTLTPFFQFSDEEGDDVALGGGATLTIDMTIITLGVQARFWFGGFFLGAGAGLASIDFDFEFKNAGPFSGTSSDSDTGTVILGMIGWEGDSGIFAYGQYETILLDDADITGFVAIVGYRFRLGGGS